MTDNIIGKRAYKKSEGMYGYTVGVVEKAPEGAPAPYVIVNDFMRLGAHEQDLAVIEEDE